MIDTEHKPLNNTASPPISPRTEPLIEAASDAVTTNKKKTKEQIMAELYEGTGGFSRF